MRMGLCILAVLALLLSMVPNFTRELLFVLSREEIGTLRKSVEPKESQKQMRKFLWGSQSTILQLKQELDTLPAIAPISEMRKQLVEHIELLETLMQENMQDSSFRALPEIVKKYDAIFIAILTAFDTARDSKLDVENYPLHRAQELVNAFINESNTFVYTYWKWQEEERERVKQSLEDQLAMEVSLLSDQEITVVGVECETIERI